MGVGELLQGADGDDDETPEDERVDDARAAFLQDGLLAEHVGDRGGDPGRDLAVRGSRALGGSQEAIEDPEPVPRIAESGSSAGEKCEGLPGHRVSVL